MKLNNHLKNFLIILGAVLIGILSGIAIIYFSKNKSNYYAVFLNNGAIYFGELSTFPRLKLDNAVFIQIDQNNQVSFQRFKEAVWSPKGPIYLNRNSVLFIAPLDEKSPLINLIEQKQSALPLLNPQNNQNNQNNQSQNLPLE